MPEVLDAFAENRSDGSPVYEEIVVERLADGTFQLIQSPGLIGGIAAGDIFALDDNRRVHVLKRSRNLCIQIFFERRDAANQKTLFTEALEPLGGRMDGLEDRLLVYTVPLAAGFGKIEDALNDVCGRTPGAAWYYGNVYDEDGVTPLNWWK